MRVRNLAMVGALVGALTVAIPQTAHAGAYNGVCEPGEVCLFWGSSLFGSLVDFNQSNVGDLVYYSFQSPAPGQGQGVKNNAASIWNRSGIRVHVCVDEWFSGSCDYVAANSWRNLNYTLNNEASWTKF